MSLFPELKLRAQIEIAVRELGPDRAFAVIARCVEQEISKYHDETTETIHRSATQSVERDRTTGPS